MDKNDESGKTYREQMVEVAKKINWLPAWGIDRELDWLKNMHDWLISKKRYWGLALPSWECRKCGNVEVIGGKKELREKAVKGWDSFENHSPHRPWVDEIKIKCSKCKNEVLRIPDVGNPWLDAGIVPFSTMPKDWFPADFITESFPGQFKNWFYSLIAMSTALKNTNPFKTVLGFASVRDEKGEEMHKSKGNAIEFNEAAQKIGADVMRWMYVTQNPEVNLNFGYGPASETKRRFYLILWNCYKFFIDYANLSNWDCKLKSGKLSVLDKWILGCLTKLALLVNERLEKYDAVVASQAIDEFIIKDFSTWYIRRSRERVSLSAEKEDRNTGFAVMYGVLVTISKLLAPFTPFIAEEIYRN
jgi:isoleucyl-tRNA synthetase